jgi:hypothetical protein
MLTNTDEINNINITLLDDEFIVVNNETNMADELN